MDDYDARVEAQLKQYEFVENMHELPASFHHFNHYHVAPRLAEVFGATSIPAMFAQALAGGRPASQPLRLLSIGSGDASFEIEVARHLIAAGHAEFTIECAEISPHLTARAGDHVHQAGMDRHFRLLQVDVNTWLADGRYEGAMAHHSLHHIVGLEHVFLNLKRALVPGGNFAVADMIGRNGHMRWPEVLDYVNLIWGFLPEEKKLNHMMRRLEPSFINHDCSGEGFEGIRAQDILPLMLEHFAFRGFTAWGGLVEVFLDRPFGPNYDPALDSDRAFIEFLARLNDDLVQAGMIKPTQMLGVLTNGTPDEPTRVHRGLTPQQAVRVP